MLLRWLIRHLCTTPAELRVVLHAIREYQLRSVIPFDQRDPGWTFDRRITRSVRLSLLVGLLVVHAENPQVFAAAWIALPLALLLGLLRLSGGLR
ncbi:hypothetical protein B0G71_1228 [Paraburkholderia sp. BL27I4N3]|uniref:hypothetical protein n=1 Tax=Paraburkholderia sp. BL27I4N3 TaxID=1938805 RepID=UPI000E223EC7|nr:hypothetical protein [Paraburkholderia sp. BL27I4N3]REE18230.1 hypothetical protein B0G71_1228 [Paraburkholderia sp. BL27I4N3]